MRRTFRDDSLDQRFRERGYLVVPFFADADVRSLQATYDELGPAPDDPRVSIFFDYQSRSEAYKRDIVERVRSRFQERADELLDGWQLFYSNFIMKWPDQRSSFGPHMDSSFVDERICHSLSVWVPLTDTGGSAEPDNGMLYVVPGSHRFVSSIRAHQPHGFPFAGSEQRIVEEFGVPLRVAAGEAVVFDHRLLHFSQPNASGAKRLVCAAGFRPDAAQLMHFRQVGSDRFDVYAIDDEFFVRLNPFELMDGPPTGYERIETRTEPQPQVTPEQLDEFVAGVGLATPRADRQFGTQPSLTAAAPFCFRCGAELGVAPDRIEHGNRTLLCDECSPSEDAGRQGSEGAAQRRRVRLRERVAAWISGGA